MGRTDMTTDMMALKRQVVDTANAIVRSGTLSMSGHGNISLRIPGRDEILFTAAGALTSLTTDHIVRLHLDGTLLEGELPPVAHEVVHMHTVVYQENGATGCVIHTHA